MSKFYPLEGPIQRLEAPITLTKFRQLLEGDIDFVDLRSGDILAVQKDSWFRLPINPSASSVAGLKPPVCGPAVICSPDDIA